MNNIFKITNKIESNVLVAKKEKNTYNEKTGLAKVFSYSGKAEDNTLTLKGSANIQLLKDFNDIKGIVNETLQKEIVRDINRQKITDVQNALRTWDTETKAQKEERVFVASMTEVDRKAYETLIARYGK